MEKKETEKKTDLAVGDNVKCQKYAGLTHDFEGRIQKIYENSAMVQITQHHEEDRMTVGDFHNRAIVSLKKMKKISA